MFGVGVEWLEEWAVLLTAEAEWWGLVGTKERSITLPCNSSLMKRQFSWILRSREFTPLSNRFLLSLRIIDLIALSMRGISRRMEMPGWLNRRFFLDRMMATSKGRCSLTSSGREWLLLWSYSPKWVVSLIEFNEREGHRGDSKVITDSWSEKALDVLGVPLGHSGIPLMMMLPCRLIECWEGWSWAGRYFAFAFVQLSAREVCVVDRIEELLFTEGLDLVRSINWLILASCAEIVSIDTSSFLIWASWSCSFVKRQTMQ